MGAHTFFQYLRLKLYATLLRAITYIVLRRELASTPRSARKLIRIPSRERNRFIKAWVYYPEHHDNSESRPLLINWHGGGYTIPNLGQDHAFCDRVVRETDFLVLDADYSKGPEKPFPAAVEDAEDVLRWVESQPRQFDLDRIALSGFSSGGSLALVVSSELRQHFLNTLNIRAVFAFYPGTDLAEPVEDKRPPVPIQALPAWVLHVFLDSYIPRLEDRKRPIASPAHADPTHFPAKTLIFACSGDVLAPEAQRFGEKLKAAGRDIEVTTIQGVAHGFDKNGKDSIYRPEVRDKVYKQVMESLRSLLA